jgi:hypothetical protein
MMDTYDCHQLFWMIRLAEKCLTRDPQKRLSMDTVSLLISEFLSNKKNYSFLDLSSFDH